MIARAGKVALETYLQPLSPILLASEWPTKYVDRGTPDSSSCPPRVTTEEVAGWKCELRFLCSTEIDSFYFLSLLRTESGDILLLDLIIDCIGKNELRLKASPLILARTLIDPI